MSCGRIIISPVFRVFLYFSSSSSYLYCNLFGVDVSYEKLKTKQKNMHTKEGRKKERETLRSSNQHATEKFHFESIYREEKR